MDTFKRKTLFNTLLVAVALVAIATDAAAQQSIGKVASSVNDSMTLANVFAYLLGGICIFMGIFKFKQSREDPRSHPLGTAVGLVLAGVFIFFFFKAAGAGILGERVAQFFA